MSSIFFSEAAIRWSLDKLPISPAGLEAAAVTAGFRPLAVSWVHASAAHNLPKPHREPFGRMLVAQAISEPLHRITSDAVLVPYGPRVTLV